MRPPARGVTVGRDVGHTRALTGDRTVAASREQRPGQGLADASLQLLTQRRDEIISDLTATLARDLPEMVEDPRLAALLEASVTENIVSAVHFVEAGTSADDLDASSAALSHAGTLAQRDVPLSALFRTYRIGHAMFVRMGLDVIAGLDEADHIPLTRLLIDRSATFIDKVCEQIGRAYEAERDQWVGDRGGIRQQWVSDLLAGRPVDLGAAETALGYRLAGTHVGVQMWLPADVADVDARSAFEATRRVLASTLQPVAPPLLVPHDEREMHAWFAVRSGTSVPVEELAAAFPATRELDVRVAVGRPESGIDGFRLTIAQAKRVKDVLLTSTNRLPHCVTYDELGAVALMAADLPALRTFVARALGDLAQAGEREETLRETLLAFLVHNRSYAATAQEMILHRNSVQYRVQRALELCGRDLNDPEVAFDLQVALQAAHWLGRAVLD